MSIAGTHDDWAARLAASVGRSHANEAELRHAAYVVLEPYALSVVGLQRHQLRHEGTSASGRFDTLLGTTLIEWKAPGELSTKSRRRLHAEQALRYLRDEEIGATVVLLADGTYWGILRDAEAHQDAANPAQEADLPSDEQFQWRLNSDESARRILDLIDTVRYERVTPNTLMNKLGPTTSQGRALLAALVAAVENRSTEGRTDFLFRQWLALAGVSYGIGRDDRAWPHERDDLLGSLSGVIPRAGYAATIFSLHTYIAICSKLIAGEALALNRGIADSRPSQWASLAGGDFVAAWDEFEDGRFSRELGAPHMIGGDLFGWYVDSLPTDSAMRDAMRAVLSSFSELAWARVTHASRMSSDLLRDFYIGVMPRQLRKGLGEFFTPEWLAGRVVERAIELSSGGAPHTLRFLDPTCGSGTFLVAAMQRVILSAQQAGLEDDEIAQLAIASVTGFDVNPVSPLMARVNLLLTLGYLAERVAELQFNVFQADSILIPEPPTGQTTIEQARYRAALTVPLVIGDVSLPEELATLPIVSELASLIDQSIRRDRNDSTFAAMLKTKLPKLGVAPTLVTASIESVLPIYQHLRQLHVEGRDGVWAHVIEQSFAPRVLEPVDIVVGNPPWISWKHLPQEWRDRSAGTWSKWGLWQEKRRGGGTPMGDISTLLAARSLATYAPSGIVALLLPQGVLLNDPGGRPFRKCVLAQSTTIEQHFKPLHVDDFTSLNPFPDAATKPVGLYLQAGEKASFPVSGTRWERAQKRAHIPTETSFSAAMTLLRPTDEQVGPVDANDIASRWVPVVESDIVDAARPFTGARYTWGQGFHTRGADSIYVCEVVSTRPLPGGLVRVRTRPDQGRNRTGMPPTEMLVEARYLWPLIKGADVQRFHTESDGLYMVVPHDPEKPSRVLTKSEALNDAPHLYEYFEPHLQTLENRSAYDLKLSADQPWGIQGVAWRHMARSRVYVACRYMVSDRRPPAAVIAPAPDSKLGITTTSYPNNKVNFVACGSVQEADYIAAFVNSAPAQHAISRRGTSTTIAPSALNALALPQFDRTNSTHRALADVGAECRTSPDLWPALQEQLGELATTLISAL